MTAPASGPFPGKPAGKHRRYIPEDDRQSWFAHAMDDIGIDSIECGVLMSVAMEARILPWGDGKGAYKLINDDIRKGTPLGRILGNGAAFVGRAYGLTRVPVVKG